MHLYKPRYRTSDGEYRSSTKWAVKFNYNGKQIVKSTGTANKAAASTRAKQIVAAADEKGWEKIRPVLPGAKKNSIEDILKLYREYATAADLSPRTVDLNICNLRRIGRDLETGQVELLDFNSWKRKNAKKKTSTVNAIHRSAASIFTPAACAFYKENGRYVENPFTGTKRSKARTEPFQGYPRKFIQSLVESAQTELRDAPEKNLPAYRLFILALFAGMRQQEAIFAEWSDLTDDGIMVKSTDLHRTKSRRTRFVPLSPSIIADLKNARESCHPQILPPTRLLKKQSSRAKRKAVSDLRDWLETKGIKSKKKVHELRKIAGSIIATDFGLYAAKEILGHSTVAVTEGFYAHLLDRAYVNVGDNK